MIPCKIYRTELDKFRTLLTFVSKNNVIYAISNSDKSLFFISPKIKTGFLTKTKKGYDFYFIDKNKFKVVFEGIDRKDFHFKSKLKKYL